MNELAPIPDLATIDQQVEQHALNVERIQRDAVFDIGRELATAQELFRYSKAEGGFTGWLARRLPHIPQASAYQAIGIFKNINPALFPDSRNIPSEFALAEVAKAEPDVQALIAERVEAGEIFTAAKVKEVSAQAATDAIVEAKARIEQLEAVIKDKAGDADMLRAQIDELSAAVKGHENRIAEYQKSLPTPKQAEKIAAEQGGLVFANDGKFHSGATPEQRALSDQYLHVWRILGDLGGKDMPPPLNVVAGCDLAYRDQLRKFCDGAIGYISRIKEGLDA